MQRDEGVIKYQCHWQSEPPLALETLAPLIQERDRLFAAGLIGVYPDGIGYGNVSLRLPGQGFVISGTQTGHLPTTGPEHYSQVTTWDIAQNYLHCTGPLKASSESLTHAALYDHRFRTGLSRIGAIAHIHHRGLWQQYQGILPTTCASVAYGTPAMAAEMIRLFHDTDLAVGRILVMAGHEDGLIAFGETVADAAQKLLDLATQGSAGTLFFSESLTSCESLDQRCMI